MSAFFWTAGHLGWGCFALLVFSALWGLGVDLAWRLRATRAPRFMAVVIAGWLVGTGAILLIHALATR